MLTQNFITEEIKQMKMGRTAFILETANVEQLAREIESGILLSARQVDGYWHVRIADIYESHKAIVEFAEVNELNVKDQDTLKRFVQEIRIIWS